MNYRNYRRKTYTWWIAGIYLLVAGWMVRGGVESSEAKVGGGEGRGEGWRQQVGGQIDGGSRYCRELPRVAQTIRPACHLAGIWQEPQTNHPIIWFGRSTKKIIALMNWVAALGKYSVGVSGDDDIFLLSPDPFFLCIFKFTVHKVSI